MLKRNSFSFTKIKECTPHPDKALGRTDGNSWLCKQSVDYSNRRSRDGRGEPAERRGQVSMSQRQQQQSAVQHAVRQALSPESSLRRSSTTYTAGQRGW